MKISKLLNKKYFSIIVFFIFLSTTQLYSVETTEPVDIWKIENQDINTSQKKREKKKDDKENIIENSIYKMQSLKTNELQILEDETLLSNKVDVAGLYDPADNDLAIDMWSNSDGKKIIELYEKINKINLSNDAYELFKIVTLTNSFSPNKNITKDEFLKLKINWLIQNNDLQLIENYLSKNIDVNQNKELIRFLVDEYLLSSNLEKSCEFFSKIQDLIVDNYLSKFDIYCLLNSNKRDEAQLKFDLKKELGFKDAFFEKKFNYLMGYDTKIDSKPSSKNILNFHLSHRTDPKFKFEPNETTSKNIWRYLSSSNLLDSIENVDLEDINKIEMIENATNEENYTEKELYDLYKRFQFNINQLLSVKQSYKLLSNVEARALVYQGILITGEIELKLELMKILKDLFIKAKISNAFNLELVRLLEEIEPEDVPLNHLDFYNKFINQEKTNLTKIKINNKIIHQSKLLNYFREDVSKKNTKKDINDLSKKIKRDKKYSISTKDKILLESLKSDGFEILSKFEDLSKTDNFNMPADIQIYINNKETGIVLLRLIEVIGQDELEELGSETLYFILSALNQLNIDLLRNRIILQVLPLKV